MNGSRQGVEYRHEFKNPLARIPPGGRLGLEPASHSTRAGSKNPGHIRWIKTHVSCYPPKALRKQHFCQYLCQPSVGNYDTEMSALTTE